MTKCQHGLTISEVTGAVFEYCEINRELLTHWHSECFLYPNGEPAEVTYRVEQVNGQWQVVYLRLSQDEIKQIEQYIAKKHNIVL